MQEHSFAPMEDSLRRAVLQAAKARFTPVLILGESGTGKEVIARAIHQAEWNGRPHGELPPVGGGAFVPIDCASLSGTLIESELFGHVKGAFTDAHADRAGLLAAADHGTAFFDEIGDMPMDLQAKLLRVIQEREFRPIGATRYRSVSMRVIAATWRDLSVAVAEGKFRQDLYYRLNVITIHLPPLRERRDEIPGLVEFFLHRHGCGGCRFSAEAMQKLWDYDWPGNIRELSNVVQRVGAMAPGRFFGICDLPREVLGAAAPPPASPIDIVSLADMERFHVLRTLDANDGDRGRTAEQLGINRATLYRKLKEYGVD